MNLSLNCIKCNSPEGLNTTMNVTYDNNAYNVKICDKCSDIVTPKTVKDCVEIKLKEFAELKEKMAQFGISINETGQSVAKTKVAQDGVHEPQEQPQKSSGPKISRNFSSEKAVPKTNITQFPQININSAIRNESEKSVAKGRITKEVAIVQEDVELQSVDGLGKVPTIIQKKIKDSTGETTIVIAKVTNDDLIKRTKGDGHFYADGYNLRQCGLCKGKGIAMNGAECPKCKGSGLI